MIRKVGDALDYIHSRNMTHFDVKPANIMVRRSDDQPILIDFGLSKQYDRQGEATSTLMQAVSHGYSPIELYNAAGIQTFSPQTDVYSLGATLYFLVTGSVPPSANELIENELTLPATVSTNLRDVIKGSMQVSRAKRPNSVYGFLNDIETPPSYKKSVQTDEDTILVEPEPVKTSTNTNQVPPTYNQVPYNHLPNLEKRSNPFINVWTILFGCLIIGFFILVVNLSTSDTNYKVNTPTVNVAAAKPASPTSVTITNYQSSLGPCTYTGEVDSEGRPHGYGKAQWDAGVGNAYFGNWVHGSMDGECTYISRGGYTFTGKFKAGHYHSGTLVSPDGSYYKGDFDSNGNKWTGTEYDSNGNITDTWKNGK